VFSCITCAVCSIRRQSAIVSGGGLAGTATGGRPRAGGDRRLSWSLPPEPLFIPRVHKVRRPLNADCTDCGRSPPSSRGPGPAGQRPDRSGRPGPDAGQHRPAHGAVVMSAIKATPDDLAAATILANRLCTVALHNDTETFRAFAITAISMALARHRRRCGRRCQGHDAAFV
jgi:hypothetical protein